MSLLTYQQARPWAKAMKEAVLLKKMPPWFADSHYGSFKNDRSMSQTDIQTLVAWADAGAPKGEAKDLPPPVDCHPQFQGAVSLDGERLTFAVICVLDHQRRNTYPKSLFFSYFVWVV